MGILSGLSKSTAHTDPTSCFQGLTQGDSRNSGFWDPSVYVVRWPPTGGIPSPHVMAIQKLGTQKTGSGMRNLTVVMCRQKMKGAIFVCLYQFLGSKPSAFFVAASPPDSRRV